MARSLEITQFNISVFRALILLAALIAAAVINPSSENSVPKVTAEDHRVTAIHESGHAVLATNLPAGGNIFEITIVSSWSILGSVAHVPATDSLSTAKRSARSMSEWIIAQGALIVDEIILDSDEANSSQTPDILAADKIAFELPADRRPTLRRARSMRACAS